MILLDHSLNPACISPFTAIRSVTLDKPIFARHNRSSNKTKRKYHLDTFFIFIFYFSYIQNPIYHDLIVLCNVLLQKKKKKDHANAPHHRIYSCPINARSIYVSSVIVLRHPRWLKMVFEADHLLGKYLTFMLQK